MEQNGTGLLCTTEGEVIKVIYDGIGIEAKLSKGENLGSILNRESGPELKSFLQEVLSYGASFGTEVFCSDWQKNLGLRLNGVITSEGIVVIAIKARPESEYDSLFDEISALNNELINARRELARKNVELDRLASIDPLIGIPNRRVIVEFAIEHFRLAKRYDIVFSLVMMDLDHFKKVNDTYGHQAGDNVLIQAGAAINRNLRDTDHVGRYGGEEILMVLPNTDAHQALQVAKRIRQDIAGEVFTVESGASFSVTVSLGVAAYNGEENLEILLERADKALYRAKESGRNQVQA